MIIADSEEQHSCTVRLGTVQIKGRHCYCPSMAGEETEAQRGQ